MVKLPERPSPFTVEHLLEAMGMTQREAESLAFRRELEVRRIKRVDDYNTWAATGKEGQ